MCLVDLRNDTCESNVKNMYEFLFLRGFCAIQKRAFSFRRWKRVTREDSPFVSISYINMDVNMKIDVI